MSAFFDHYQINPRELYSKTSFSRLAVLAGIKEDFQQPDEEQLRKSMARLSDIDSRRVITFWLEVLQGDKLEASGFNALEPTIFVREYKKDMAGVTMPYTFLGPAQYVQHQGSRPMSIVWRLEQPIPARFLKKTNKMIVG